MSGRRFRAACAVNQRFDPPKPFGVIAVLVARDVDRGLKVGYRQPSWEKTLLLLLHMLLHSAAVTKRFDPVAPDDPGRLRQKGGDPSQAAPGEVRGRGHAARRWSGVKRTRPARTA